MVNQNNPGGDKVLRIAVSLARAVLEEVLLYSELTPQGWRHYEVLKWAIARELLARCNADTETKAFISGLPFWQSEPDKIKARSIALLSDPDIKRILDEETKRQINNLHGEGETLP